MACGASTITGNVYVPPFSCSVLTIYRVTDATDGGIVIFGAENSKVTGNTVRSRSSSRSG